MYILIAICSLFITGCGNFLTPAPQQKAVHKPYVINNSFGRFVVRPQQHIELEDSGIASYYGSECHGKKTALGSTFNMHAYTAAHRTAHLPSVAIVTFNNNKRIVLLNDRGPFAKNRVLDCSKKLAQDLGFARQGHAKVHIKVLKDETLALKQNGGNISWDGSNPFPMITKHTKPIAHFAPTSKIVINRKTCSKHKKNKIKISIKKLNRKNRKIKFI